VPASGGKKARVETLYRTDRLEPLAEALAVLQFARAQVRPLPVHGNAAEQVLESAAAKGGGRESASARLPLVGPRQCGERRGGSLLGRRMQALACSHRQRAATRFGGCRTSLP
jgi:hypothetical protein